MKKIKKADFIIIAVLLAVIVCAVLFAVQRNNDSKTESQAPAGTAEQTAETRTITYNDYSGKKIGVQTGTIFDEMIKENIPDADISYYNSYTDLLSALKAGIIDGFAADEPMIKYMMAEDSAVDYLRDYMDDYSFGFAFSKDSKGEALCSEFSEYIKKIKSDGTLAEIDSIWFGKDESKKVIPAVSTLSGGKGKLSLAVESANAPFVFIKNNEIVGYEVDIAYRFCKEYGYGLELVDMNFDGIIPAVSSGKCSFGCSTITITEERRESVNFSEPHYDGGSVLAVRASDMAGTATLSAENAEPSYTEYNGKRIGIKTGSSFEPITLEKFPDSEYYYFDNESDLIQALQNNKIDGFLDDEPVAAMVHVEQPDVNYLKKNIMDDDYHFGFQKNTERSEKLRSEFNELVAELISNGELDNMKRKWLGNDESAKTFDNSELTGSNGEIMVVVTPDNIPFSYTANNQLTGYAVELSVMFARKYGYTIKFEQAPIAAGLAGVTSGKYDILATSLSYTEERAQSMDFSDVIYNGGVMLVVRSSDLRSVSSSGAVEDRPLSYYAENGKIGAITGGLYEIELNKRYPNAEILQYNAQPDLAIALSEGKIDAFTCPLSSAKDFMAADSSLTYLKEVFMKIPYGFAFKKTDGTNVIRDQMNEFLAKLHSDGTYDEIVDIWFGDDESRKTVDYTGLDGNGTVLRYITASTMQPYSYIKDGQNAGLEADIIARFCREYGYGLKIDNADFAALIPGITSGTYDVASGTIMITEERAQSVDFSDVYYTTDAVAVVRKENTDQTLAEEHTKELGFFAGIKESFNKNFIREDRYKLILQGIGTTCIITVLSVIFGSVLAFLICLFRRADSVLSGKISDLYVKLMQGTPMVVLLMILYYVIFGKSGIAAMWVAVIGFSMNFAAYVSEILRSGIESIDGGQREAALALGYSENQAFFRFIFPQAAVRQLSVYRGEIISLLKNTSIVGYIAIQDLTKMSDIIRSRTYEAFFPLIVTAVIYFILAWIISLILKFIFINTDPKSKRKASGSIAVKNK